MSTFPPHSTTPTLLMPWIDLNRSESATAYSTVQDSKVNAQLHQVPRPFYARIFSFRVAMHGYADASMLL